MSLDVYLRGAETKCACCGQAIEGGELKILYDSNITNNLVRMADAAGVGSHIWSPEDLGITKAKELIEPLQAALTDMVARPDYYKTFDSSNGCGTYIDFVPWIEEYLAACKRFPEATIETSR